MFRPCSKVEHRHRLTLRTQGAILLEEELVRNIRNLRGGSRSWWTCEQCFMRNQRRRRDPRSRRSWWRDPRSRRSWWRDTWRTRCWRRDQWNLRSCRQHWRQTACSKLNAKFEKVSCLLILQPLAQRVRWEHPLDHAWRQSRWLRQTAQLWGQAEAEERGSLQQDHHARQEPQGGIQVGNLRNTHNLRNWSHKGDSWHWQTHHSQVVVDSQGSWIS